MGLGRLLTVGWLVLVVPKPYFNNKLRKWPGGCKIYSCRFVSGGYLAELYKCVITTLLQLV